MRADRKRVWLLGDPPRLLATFLRRGEVVTPQWEDEAFGFELRRTGIVVGGEVLRPADGVPFYEALEAGLAGQSSLTVTN